MIKGYVHIDFFSAFSSRSCNMTSAITGDKVNPLEYQNLFVYLEGGKCGG